MRRPGRLALVLAVVSVATLACALPALAVMGDHGVDIVAYELARTTDRASELNGMLGAEGRDAARTSLWWDYPFLVSYGAMLVALCLLVGRGSARGRLFAYVAAAAALCDAVEDAALLRVAAGHEEQPWPGLAFVFASAKFVLLLACIAYVVATAVRNRRAQPSSETVRA